MKRYWFVAMCLIWLQIPSDLMAQEKVGIITTVAGNGIIGFSGDGGPATKASLNYPYDVAVDTNGVIYIADTNNHRIRRVGLDGVITTIAGTGMFAKEIDFLPTQAIKTDLTRPLGLDVDEKGNVYIAEADQKIPFSLIRRLAPDGVLKVISGGIRGFSGDNGPAIEASLYTPRGIVADTRGNVYIADIGNHRIRRIDTNGIITTIAGTGMSDFSGDGDLAIKAKLSFPTDVAADRKGYLYIADSGNRCIRRVSPDGIITTIAGKGPVGGRIVVDGQLATQGIQPVECVAVDANGIVYILPGDLPGSSIRWIDLNGVISTVAGSTQSQLNSARGIALDRKGNIYIADTGNHRIRRITGNLTEVSNAKINLSISSLKFDSTKVGEAAEKTFTISNTGSGNLSVTGITISGADTSQFKVSPTIATIVAGGNQTITVTFAPTSSGSKSVLLHIYHNASGSPSIVTLNGVSVPPPPPVESNIGAFLAFPLPRRDPYNVRINSVFDHSMDRGSYTADGIVVAYTGERGERTSKQSDQDYVTTINGNRLSGYRGTVPSFKINGNYSGGEFLYYDGHPGFDYRTKDNDQDPINGQVNVLAAADGVVTLFKDVDSTLAINHGNDYITYYLHLSKRTVSGGARVKKGDIIGISGASGATYTDSNGRIIPVPHLHFEVRLSGVPVDPYGWQGSGRDPYESRAKNVNLWIKPTVAPPPPTPDFNGDGIVDLSDFFLFAGAFGHKAAGEYTKFDLDGDGEIGLGDFFVFAASFGKRV